jgi:hypothetical protein
LLADAASLFAAPMAKTRNKVANSALTINGRVLFFTVSGINLKLAMLILFFIVVFEYWSYLTLRHSGWTSAPSAATDTIVSWSS